MAESDSSERNKYRSAQLPVVEKANFLVVCVSASGIFVPPVTFCKKTGIATYLTNGPLEALQRHQRLGMGTVMYFSLVWFVFFLVFTRIIKKALLFLHVHTTHRKILTRSIWLVLLV